MRHLRKDYSAIQPFPTKRPHIVKIDGETVDAEQVENLGKWMDPIIPDDEPVFLLRAKDAFAPNLVRDWAAQLDHKGPHSTQELSGNPSEWCNTCALVKKVYEWAEAMEEYAKEHHEGGKIPDVPKEFLR